MAVEAYKADHFRQQELEARLTAFNTHQRETALRVAEAQHQARVAAVRHQAAPKAAALAAVVEETQAQADQAWAKYYGLIAGLRRIGADPGNE